MEAVNMLQAKSSLSRLVEAIERGEEREIVIARNGRPAAKVDAVGYHARQLEDETKALAKQAFIEQQLKQQKESPQLGRLLLLYVDDTVPDATPVRNRCGGVGSIPGNSQPPARSLPWAWPMRHQARSRCSTTGLSMAWRSLAPLPCSTRSAMRSLSTSPTLSRQTSLARRPEP